VNLVRSYRQVRVLLAYARGCLSVSGLIKDVTGDALWERNASHIGIAL